MKNYKVIQLISLLSSKEQKSFGSVIKKHKRKTLYALYHALKKYANKNKEIEVAAIYQEVFKEAYENEQNYLLRNEMRHLTTALTQFLTQEQWQKTLQQNKKMGYRFFLQTLLQKKAYDLFETEYQKALKDCLKTSDYVNAYHLMQQYVDYLLLHQQPKQENYEHLLSLIHQNLFYAKMVFLHRFTTTFQKQTITERVLQTFNTKQTITPLSSLQFDWANENADWKDNYVHYMILLIQSYTLKGRAKIKVLQQAYDLVDVIVKDNFNNQHIKASTAATIALEYFLIQDYTASLPYHQEAIKHQKQLPTNQFISYIFNYLGTLLRLQQYTNALNLMEQHKATLMNNLKIKDLFICQKAMCHLFLNEPEKAATLLPDHRKNSGLANYFYYRFIEMIVFYQRKEWALAANEADNILHSLHYHKTEMATYTHYQQLASLYKRYFNLCMDQKIKTNLTSKLRELAVELNNYNQRIVQKQNQLLVDWLERELRLAISC